MLANIQRNAFPSKPKINDDKALLKRVQSPHAVTAADVIVELNHTMPHRPARDQGKASYPGSREVGKMACLRQGPHRINGERPETVTGAPRQCGARPNYSAVESSASSSTPSRW